MHRHSQKWKHRAASLTEHIPSLVNLRNQCASASLIQFKSSNRAELQEAVSDRLILSAHPFTGRITCTDMQTRKGNFELALPRVDLQLVDLRNQCAFTSLLQFKKSNPASHFTCGRLMILNTNSLSSRESTHHMHAQTWKCRPRLPERQVAS